MDESDKIHNEMHTNIAKLIINSDENKIDIKEIKGDIKEVKDDIKTILRLITPDFSPGVNPPVVTNFKQRVRDRKKLDTLEKTVNELDVKLEDHIKNC